MRMPFDVNSHTQDYITLTSPRHCLKGWRLRIDRNMFFFLNKTSKKDSSLCFGVKKVPDATLVFTSF